MAVSDKWHVLSSCFYTFLLPHSSRFSIPPVSLLMVKRHKKIVDVQPVKEKNRRGANVYRIIDAPKASTSTSQPHTDGSRSPSKRMRSLSPVIGNGAGNDETPPTKKLKRKTKVWRQCEIWFLLTDLHVNKVPKWFYAWMDSLAGALPKRVARYGGPPTGLLCLWK